MLDHSSWRRVPRSELSLDSGVPIITLRRGALSPSQLSSRQMALLQDVTGIIIDDVWPSRSLVIYLAPRIVSISMSMFTTVPSAHRISM